MTKAQIEKLDNQGRGICYIDSKITFVKNALPTEKVEVKLIKETKKYQEAIVKNYIETSKKRVKSPCPYFNQCGGCSLLHSTYEDTLKYKKEKLENIMVKYAKQKTDIEIIASPNNLSYRNKITLKIKNGQYGYFKNATHELVKIKNCLLAEPAIQNFLKNLSHLHIKNGELICRSNYNNELLLWIKTKEPIIPDIEYLKKHHKIAGIILNGKVIHGEPSFIEIINKQIFTVSYDSFFQVNRQICSTLFHLVNEYIKEEEIILDLYCGVGTLGINARKKAKKVYGIEIVKNAVLNAITNAKINKRNNMYYILGEVASSLSKIQEQINTVIVDPPRMGLDNTTKEILINLKPSKIVYVSCDPITLARDISDLSKFYKALTIKGLDMFPFTHHVECVCVLCLR